MTLNFKKIRFLFFRKKERERRKGGERERNGERSSHTTIIVKE